MTEEKFISVDSGGNRNGGWNPADFAALMGNNRSGLFGGNGIWDGVLGLFGLGLVANMFPGFIGGNRGGNSGNDQAAAAYLSNMLQNNNGTDLLMEHVTGVGNRVVELAQAFNTSTAAVQAGLSNIQLAMVQLAAQNNMSVAQLQLQLQQGQSDIALQFCKNCSDQALAICQQTNTLVNAGNENTQRIVDTQNGNARAILQQMYNDKLEAKNDLIGELRAKVIAKDGEISQMQQNQLLIGNMAQMQAALQAQIAGVKSEVDAVKRCQPATLTLPDNRFQAVPTGIANIGSDFIGTLAVARLFGLLGTGTGTGTDTGTTTQQG
ncbi:MAG: hypothetical protein IJV36_04790 [Prevotella sp.]|nr:hypothetical protein [Prevotella sp.]